MSNYEVSTRFPCRFTTTTTYPKRHMGRYIYGFHNRSSSSAGKTVIMVVVDRLSKYAHFSALPTRFSAPLVAQIFVTDVCRLHGIPKTVVSDRDKVFISHFWRELFRLWDTLVRRIIHKDGQTEVINRGLEQYLRCFTMDKPQAWISFLPWAEYSNNTAFHSSTGYSPFQIIYGRPPHVIHPYQELSTPIEAVEHNLLQRDQALRELKDNLQRVQHRMKQVADKNVVTSNFKKVILY